MPGQGQNFEHLHLAETSRELCLGELELLCRHIEVDRDRCPRCMKKHALVADAYAREALGLTGAGALDEKIAAATAAILTGVKRGMLDDIPAIVRHMRVEWIG